MRRWCIVVYGFERQKFLWLIYFNQFCLRVKIVGELTRLERDTTTIAQARFLPGAALHHCW